MMQKNKLNSKEADNVLQTSDRLYKENQEIIQQWEKEKMKWDNEREKLKLEIASLENENKTYLDKI